MWCYLCDLKWFQAKNNYVRTYSKSLKLYIFSFRVVKRSSYRLNSLILVGVFVGFVGTLLHVIRLDSDMSKTFTTTVCNVSEALINVVSNIHCIG